MFERYQDEMMRAVTRVGERLNRRLRRRVRESKSSDGFAQRRVIWGWKGDYNNSFDLRRFIIFHLFCIRK